MSFSAEWLALREPADHAARDRGLLRRAVAAAGPKPVVLDLGCGTGSTVRAMRAQLPSETRWRLVDNDAALTESAAQDAGGETETFVLDISDLEVLPLRDVTLVTASALLDLVPEDWLRQLALRLKVPFYAALSYDGEMCWTPEMETDAAVTEAFNAHQRSEKGMGRALGPDAAKAGAALLEEAGFSVVQAESPWCLGPTETALQRELVDGITDSALQMGCSSAAAWGEARRDAAATSSARIGHRDLLALPPGIAGGNLHAPD
ncbi:methyltransferase domain-containing protein [Roseovarius aestuariivivens]|uniref:methyltransferase domain-containing protein n=1 Tax=Roseovarius aestuariivivens TaxID=1888910 RepID=UPI0010814173|nr:class I SAM-dependent methyltransferase [Roseovarius aestuariivivens]